MANSSILSVIALLQSAPIFAGIEENALQLLLEHTSAHDHPEGSVICSEGAPCNRFFLIGSGTVRVCKNFGQTHQVELAALGPKDFFGESAILDTLPRMATVQATSSTVVFDISSMAFYHLYQKMPAQHSILLLNIARDLSRRIRALDEALAARH